jgi:hypothetical protein
MTPAFLARKLTLAKTAGFVRHPLALYFVPSYDCIQYPYGAARLCIPPIEINRESIEQSPSIEKVNRYPPAIGGIAYRPIIATLFFSVVNIVGVFKKHFIYPDTKL